MKLISLLALLISLVAAIFLYLASAPVSGTIQFVGGSRTEQDIKASERRRKVQRVVGFVLLLLSAVAQAVVIYSAP